MITDHFNNLFRELMLEKVTQGTLIFELMMNQGTLICKFYQIVLIDSFIRRVRSNPDCESPTPMAQWLQ